jgi:hypothetical protein
MSKTKAKGRFQVSHPVPKPIRDMANDKIPRTIGLDEARGKIWLKSQQHEDTLAELFFDRDFLALLKPSGQLTNAKAEFSGKRDQTRAKRMLSYVASGINRKLLEPDAEVADTMRVAAFHVATGMLYLFAKGQIQIDFQED